MFMRPYSRGRESNATADCLSVPEMSRAMPPQAFGEDIEVPFISSMPRRVQLGTDATAPPGAVMHTPRAPSTLIESKCTRYPNMAEVGWIQTNVSKPKIIQINLTDKGARKVKTVESGNSMPSTNT